LGTGEDPDSFTTHWDSEGSTSSMYNFLLVFMNNSRTEILLTLIVYLKVHYDTLIVTYPYTTFQL